MTGCAIGHANEGVALVYRCAVTALAQGLAVPLAASRVRQATMGGNAIEVVQLGSALLIQAESAQPLPSKRPLYYLWAVLIARIYEVFPLLTVLLGQGSR